MSPNLTQHVYARLAISAQHGGFYLKTEENTINS